MKLALLPLAFAFALAACGGGDSTVCPSGWSQNAGSLGGCEPPASFLAASSGTGVYGFVRSSAHGGDKLVVGTKVFALAATSQTCDAASVNAVAQAVTDNDGVFTLTLAAGDYLITTGEVPTCAHVRVDAGQMTEQVFAN